MNQEEQERLLSLFFKESRGSIIVEYFLILAQLMEGENFIEPAYDLGENGEGAEEIVLGPMNNLEKACWTLRELLEKVEYIEDECCPISLQKDIFLGTINNTVIYASALNRFNDLVRKLGVCQSPFCLVFRKGYRVAIYQNKPRQPLESAYVFSSADPGDMSGGGPGGCLC